MSETPPIDLLTTTFVSKTFLRPSKPKGILAHRFVDANYLRNLLNHAVDIFSSRPYLGNEVARSRHKRGQMYRDMGNDVQAEEEFAKAYESWQNLRPGDKRARDEVYEADFDELVIFWSR